MLDLRVDKMRAVPTEGVSIAFCRVPWRIILDIFQARKGACQGTESAFRLRHYLCYLWANNRVREEHTERREAGSSGSHRCLPRA